MTAEGDILIDRVRENDRYTIIANEILQDPDISPDAQFIATYLLSLPSDWNINMKHIWNSKNISRDRVWKAFNELQRLGYMSKKEVKSNGKFAGLRYQIAAFKKFLPSTEKPCTENPGSEFQGYTKDCVYKEIKEQTSEKAPRESPICDDEYSEEELNILNDAYEHIDILQEYRLAKAWIVENPSKAPKGFKRFFKNWLKKKKSTSSSPRSASPSSSPRSLEQRIREDLPEEHVEAALAYFKAYSAALNKKSNPIGYLKNGCEKGWLYEALSDLQKKDQSEKTLWEAYLSYQERFESMGDPYIVDVVGFLDIAENGFKLKKSILSDFGTYYPISSVEDFYELQRKLYGKVIG